jgi:hypothetical protein
MQAQEEVGWASPRVHRWVFSLALAVGAIGGGIFFVMAPLGRPEGDDGLLRRGAYQSLGDSGGPGKTEVRDQEPGPFLAMYSHVGRPFYSAERPVPSA